MIRKNGKKLNSGLKRKQEEVRQQTVARIRDAILSFKEEGYEDITIQMLINQTGYSRPTFGKEHVQELLREHKIAKYRVVIKLPSQDEEKLKYLEKELYKAKEANIKLKQENLRLTDKNKKLQEEVSKGKEEIEFLRNDIYELEKQISTLKDKNMN